MVPIPVFSEKNNPFSQGECQVRFYQSHVKLKEHNMRHDPRGFILVKAGVVALHTETVNPIS